MRIALLVLAIAAPALAAEPDAPAVVKTADAPATAPTPPTDTWQPNVPNHTLFEIGGGVQSDTGNSQLLKANGKLTLDSQVSDNGFLLTAVGNYSQSAGQDKPVLLSVENFEGSARYDRFYSKGSSNFLSVTGRYDFFEGLDLQLNVDLGYKLVFVKNSAFSFWAELGYDFQLKLFNSTVLAQADQEEGQALPGSATLQSIRGYLGATYAFNKFVDAKTGVEWLQGLYDDALGWKPNEFRVVYDISLKATLVKGLSVSLSFNLRYDNAPLPDVLPLDTSTTANLTYKFETAPSKT